MSHSKRWAALVAAAGLALPGCASPLVAGRDGQTSIFNMPWSAKDGQSSSLWRWMRRKPASQDEGQPLADERLPAALMDETPPSDADMRLVGIAKQLEKRGEDADAEKLYEAALREHPNDATANHRLGVLLAKRGELPAAERRLRLALAHDGQCVELHNDLGYCCYLQGRHAEAETCFRRALKIDPDHVTSRNNLSRVLEETGTERQVAEHAAETEESQLAEAAIDKVSVEPPATTLPEAAAAPKSRTANASRAVAKAKAVVELPAAIEMASPPRIVRCADTDDASTVVAAAHEKTVEAKAELPGPAPRAEEKQPAPAATEETLPTRKVAAPMVAEDAAPPVQAIPQAPAIEFLPAPADADPAPNPPRLAGVKTPMAWSDLRTSPNEPATFAPRLVSAPPKGSSDRALASRIPAAPPVRLVEFKADGYEEHRQGACATPVVESSEDEGIRLRVVQADVEDAATEDEPLAEAAQVEEQAIDLPAPAPIEEPALPSSQRWAPPEEAASDIAVEIPPTTVEPRHPPRSSSPSIAAPRRQSVLAPVGSWMRGRSQPASSEPALREGSERVEKRIAPTTTDEGAAAPGRRTLFDALRNLRPGE